MIRTLPRCDLPKNRTSIRFDSYRTGQGMPIDMLVQIGLVVLMGMAAKKSYLIVEFAR